jgi:hypothetical protein
MQPARSPSPTASEEDFECDASIKILQPDILQRQTAHGKEKSTKQPPHRAGPWVVPSNITCDELIVGFAERLHTNAAILNPDVLQLKAQKPANGLWHSFSPEALHAVIRQLKEKKLRSDKSFIIKSTIPLTLPRMAAVSSFEAPVTPAHTPARASASASTGKFEAMRTAMKRDDYDWGVFAIKDDKSDEQGIMGPIERRVRISFLSVIYMYTNDISGNYGRRCQ